MTKKAKVTQLLNLIKERCEEFLDVEESMGLDMGPEELVIASVEMVLNESVTNIEYTFPVANIDRKQVSFCIDDNMDVALYGEEDDHNPV